MRHGDVIGIGGVEFVFEAITLQEHEIQKRKRIVKSSPLPPWASFVTLSIFQVLTTLEFIITRPENIRDVLIGYGILFAVMWIYVLFTKALGQTGFEPEILAFFACTLNLAVTATSSPGIMLKQAICICIGVVGFIFLGWYLSDLERTVKTRRFMAAVAIGLFVINIVFGKVLFGAKNWISIMGVSVQPSELAKICFIFAGAATLDRLFVKKNLFGFMCLSGFCLMALAVMGDFGTAAIFFVVFLVIAFLRSGDFATLTLICGATVAAIALVLRFKPYIASRFAVWGHVWEDASGMGYQQVRTMSAAASGGLIGVGPGTGWLHNIAAANTDLVFGILCEEWGLIIALLSVAIIISLSIFVFRVTRNGRSSYYTIAACAATSMFVFQTILNVFGSVDILPLTGVTFPFISCGGTSMITCWCLLAFVKASDTRQNASFAVKKKIQLGDVPDDPLAAILKTSTPVVEPEPELIPEPQPLSPEEEIDAFFRQFEEMDVPDFDDGFEPLKSDFNLYDEFRSSPSGFDLFEDEFLGKAPAQEEMLGRPPRKKRFPYKGGDDR
ncbi:MAG: FtsW/RodA/SpoVE family cell cycle protein, partial [Firmicutes bacterium]|nr:FtsW/RodA/SpoVE family cell cycle protein [Bacillota bacterium]